MRSFALALALALVGCSGDSPGTPDGGPKCSGAIYDKCNTEHDCLPASPICQPFGAIQVCTTGCSASSPCPNDSSGAPGTCTAANQCQPAAANYCHL